MRERIYKGATRPPMKCGVPLKVFVPVVGIGFVGSMWGGQLFGWKVAVSIAVLCLIAIMLMRAVTKYDDQGLFRLWMWLRLQLLHRNRHIWKSRSYSPVVYRGASDDWIQ